MASSTLSLTEQLSVSASASLKYGMTASGSAKTSFLSKFKQNSFTIYIVVQVTVTNKQTLLDLTQSKLTPDAERLFSTNPQQFIQQYGDSFVYGLKTGGEFIGVLEIESFSSSQFREIKASLSGKASFGLNSGNAKASFEKSLEAITSDYQMRATVLRQGGGGALQPVTPDSLITQALNFPDTVKGNDAYPYVALVIPYNHIPHPIASPLDVSNQMTVLEQIGAWRQRLLKYQNDLTFALDHQDQFPGIDVSAVNTRFNQISSEITTVVSAARDCFNDQSKCSAPQFELTLLENVLPPQIGDDDMAKLEVQIQQLANELAATKVALASAQQTASQALDIANSVDNRTRNVTTRSNGTTEIHMKDCNMIFFHDENSVLILDNASRTLVTIK